MRRLCTLVLLAACGTHAAMSSSPEPFACGTLTCDASTQYCSVVESTHPGGMPTYACVAADGGVPSCGSSSVSSPDMCGCYASPTGEITITSCPP
jgi:hypothetical protein